MPGAPTAGVVTRAQVHLHVGHVVEFAAERFCPDTSRSARRRADAHALRRVNGALGQVVQTARRVSYLLRSEPPYLPTPFAKAGSRSAVKGSVSFADLIPRRLPLQI